MSRVDETDAEAVEDEIESYSTGIGAQAPKKSAEPKQEAPRPEKLDAAAVTSGAGAASAREVSSEIHSSADLLAKFGDKKAADAPMCMTCGTKMRPAGSCYVCEGCGSTSGCS
jgi:ribonucleoside-diphosphate reductase alpha chain